jgi:uncharacterized protein YqeY
MRQALPEAMRARDKVAVSALRATLAALDNAEAVPVDDDATVDWPSNSHRSVQAPRRPYGVS